EKSKIYLGLNALHLSNGGFKKPNYGLNMLGASGGFSIAFSNKRECKVPKKSSDDLQIETWPQIKLYVGMGVKETGDAGGPKYFPVSLQIAAAHRVAKFVALGFGVDIAHDGSSKFQIEQSNEVYTSPNDAFQVGASIYAELPLNRFSVFARQGFYLYNANPDLPFGYQNIGFSYRIGHRVAIFISLKSHLNNADHIYAGLALSI
ncbi:MAG TPA: acyloxyacyl hydrolase, partial [Tenuifilaceae bacterium]|nr:acyloxyacyl hydrolase [Tenuifilaceae bacterium]